MNTRLQVEHPVTEAVFGLDLVALQLSVAEGEPLPTTPPTPHGHAVEARLYAEDPARDWQPQTGALLTLDVPDEPGLRLDTGYTGGDTIGIHYDPMLAKVIAHAPTRAQAVRLLARALERTRIHGPVTNRELLVRSLRHPDFTGARPDTGFYDRHLDALTRTPGDNADRHLAALAAAAAHAARHPDAVGTSRFGGWRNLPSQPQIRRYRSEPDGAEHEIAYRTTRSGAIETPAPGSSPPPPDTSPSKPTTASPTTSGSSPTTTGSTWTAPPARTPSPPSPVSPTPPNAPNPAPCSPPCPAPSSGSPTASHPAPPSGPGSPSSGWRR